MNRKQARECAMQALFEMEAQQDFSAEEIERCLARIEAGKQASYVRRVLTAVSDHRAEIDQRIDHASHGWRLSRLAKTDLAVLRLATAEILYMEDIPKRVAINEAVDLAKRYGTEQSPQFVNAVLGKIYGEETVSGDRYQQL